MCQKKFYTKKLAEKVASNAKPKISNRYHVIFSGEERWAVVADGNKRASKVFSNKSEAIEFAKKNAIKLNGKIVVHKRTGKIQDLLSFSK
mgnify:CR=1 FL=1